MTPPEFSDPAEGFHLALSHGGTIAGPKKAPPAGEGKPLARLLSIKCRLVSPV